MDESAYQIFKDPRFDEWFNDQPARVQLQILKRFSNIEQHSHFGDHKSVSSHETGSLKNMVWELRWQDGRRVYYAYIP